MRSDLAKVTTENRSHRSTNPRFYRGFGGRVPIVNDPDYLYEDEFGGIHRSSRRKHRNYDSTAIDGALNKSVGRPWNDVYSEFCAVLDSRNYHQSLILRHIVKYAVKTTGIYEGADGVVYEYRAGSYCERSRFDPHTGKSVNLKNPIYHISVDSPVDGFYVHPRTGLLCDAGLEATVAGNRGRRYLYPPVAKPEPEPIAHIALSHEMQETDRYYSGGTYLKKVCTEWFARELCGRRPRSRFYGWFYYVTKTSTKYGWERIAGAFAKNAHFEGVEVAPYVSPAEERHYRMRPDKYQRHPDGFWYARRKETTTKTTKHSVTRAQMASIREYLAKHSG